MNTIMQIMKDEGVLYKKLPKTRSLEIKVWFFEKRMKELVKQMQKRIDILELTIQQIAKTAERRKMKKMKKGLQDAERMDKYIARCLRLYEYDPIAD